MMGSWVYDGFMQIVRYVGDVFSDLARDCCIMMSRWFCGCFIISCMQVFSGFADEFVGLRPIDAAL